MEASLEQLQSIDGVGDVVAESMFKWLQNNENIKLVNDLVKTGVEVQSTKGKPKGKFTGTTWVFTGTMASMTRDEAGAKVQAMGGNVTNSVSKSTSYVVAGTEPGSKYDKAKKLGVTILNEKQFLSKI